LADQRQGQGYQGKIGAETALYWVQQIPDNTFVAHLKNGLDGDIKLQNFYQIKPTDRGRANVELLRP